MSDILNHYYCARETYKLLHKNKDIKELIDKYFDAYRLGTQGPDFFYYNIISKDSKLSRKIGTLIHSENINKFFYYGVKFTELNPEYKDITLAYLLGFISHFELDITTHPFIFYRTGNNSFEKSEISQSKALHKLYEVLLDTAMMQYEYSKLAVNLNPEKVFYIKPYTLEFLEKFYQYILKEVYGITVTKKIIKNALLCAGFLINQFKDNNGTKRKIVKSIEKLIKKDHLVSQLLYPSYTNEFDILNLDKKSWLNPETGEIHNESYPELYYKAAKNAAKQMETFIDLVNKEELSLDNINKIFKDRSFLTGDNFEKKQTQKFIDQDFKQNLIENY